MRRCPRQNLGQSDEWQKVALGFLTRAKVAREVLKEDGRRQRKKRSLDAETQRAQRKIETEFRTRSQNRRLGTRFIQAVSSATSEPFPQGLKPQ